MRLILVGYMACGKSSIGKKIAEKLNTEFIDTDSIIEGNNNCSVSDIFTNNGEEYFRDEETKLLKKILLDKKDAVIATGGGMPVREENRILLKKIGYVIYLQTDVDEILKRVESDTTRPLLICDDKRVHISNMINKRHPIYINAANTVIDTLGKSIDEIVNEIIRIYKNDLDKIQNCSEMR